MKIVERSIKDLIPAEYNPRQLSNEQATHLEASLKRFGAVDPAIINTHPDRKNIIIGGHQRLKMAQRLGWETFPCVELELDKEKERELNIRLNKNTGGWDYDALANYFEVEELTDWGFSDEELFADIETEELEAEEDDYQEPDEIHTDIVLGDLIEIGPHRLLCGDSIDSDQVAKLMDGEKSELLFTSPPYSDMREYNGDKELSIEYIIEFITTFFQYCEYQVVNLGIQRKNGEIYQYWDNYINKATNNGYKFLSWNIWNRENAGFSIANITSMFATQHEWIFVFGKKSKKLNLTVENKEAGNKRNEVANRQKDGSVKRKKAPIIRDKRQLGTINTINPQLARDKNIKHPAMFPVDLPSEYIKAMTNENDIISEPFLGSGTTMVASHQLKRKCYGMELDPKYCQVIIDRMRKLDDTLEIKINGEPYGVQD